MKNVIYHKIHYAKSPVTCSLYNYGFSLNQFDLLTKKLDRVITEENFIWGEPT